MKIGYIRVSTIEQNEARQFEIMEKYGVEKIYNEKVSGKNTDRPQLKAMLDFAREGDTIYIESYSRLARSTKDLLDLVEKLTKNGIDLVSYHENIDTSTPSGKLMLTVFAGLAEFERSQMLERQREGIALAKAKGKYTGRKKIQPNEKEFKKLYSEWKDGNITARECMRRLNLKPNTFYRRVAEWEKSNLKEE